jgi:hypothetical protein
MNSKKLKRNMIVSIILFVIIAGNVARMHTLDNMRAVDAVQLTGLGAMLGALVVNVVMFMKFKDKQ